MAKTRSCSSASGRRFNSSSRGQGTAHAAHQHRRRKGPEPQMMRGAVQRQGVEKMRVPRGRSHHAKQDIDRGPSPARGAPVCRRCGCAMPQRAGWRARSRSTAARRPWQCRRPLRSCAHSHRGDIEPLRQHHVQPQAEADGGEGQRQRPGCLASDGRQRRRATPMPAHTSATNRYAWKIQLETPPRPRPRSRDLPPLYARGVEAPSACGRPLCSICFFMNSIGPFQPLRSTVRAG